MSLEELGLPSDVLVWKAALLTVISFAVGILAGFVGLALGTVRLPALLLLGVSAPVAAGTNIIVSTASSIIGAAGHLRAGRVSPRLVLAMGIPSFAGAFIGGFYGYLAPESLLIFSVGALVLWQGIELVVRVRSQVELSSPGAVRVAAATVGSTGAFGRERVTLAAAMGLSIGVVGGAVGLILGTLRIPALVRVLKVDPRTAAGTNMFIGMIMGATGWVGHVARGQVDYPLAALLASSAMAGVYIGVRLMERVSLGRLLTTMGLVMVLVGTLLIWRAAAM